MTQEPGVYITNPDGSVECLYRPTEKQQEAHASTVPSLLMEGSRGTGKSVYLRWDAHMRALATPGWTGVILRRTYPELWKSHLIFIENEAKKLGAIWKSTDKVVIYPNGSKLFFSHCEDDSAVLNLLSAQFVWMGIDEGTTFSWEMITKLATSVRVPQGSGLIAMLRITTNPLGESVDDIWKYYVDKDVEPEEDEEYNPDDYHSIHTIMADNPHLDQKQYVKRFAGMPPHVKKAWLDGERIYERALFNFQPTKGGKPYHVITELPTAEVDGVTKTILELPWVRIYRVYDDGWFPDPSVCLWAAVFGRRVIWFREQTWYETTAKEIAREILEESKPLTQGITATYCDPKCDVHTTADVLSIKGIMEAEGMAMDCAINDRELFAKVLHNALNEEVAPGIPRMQILRPGNYSGVASGCPMLIKALPKMRYDDRHTTKMADHKLDHWPVAVCYFHMSHIPTTEASSPASALPRWMRSVKNTLTLGSESVSHRAR